MPEQSLNGLLCRLVEELVSQGIPLQQAKREFERRYLLAALDQQEGNLTRSAEALGVHRNTLRNKMSALGIKGS
jgi:DNA-binding NtrC family response regulator